MGHDQPRRFTHAGNFPVIEASSTSRTPSKTTTNQQKSNATIAATPAYNMASSSGVAPSSSSSPKSPTAKSTADIITRNTLRYTISAKEYESLHKYIISRSKVLKRNAPSVAKVEKLVERQGRGDDYNAAAVRASLRVFLATSAGLKAWAVIKQRFLGGQR